MRGDTSPTCTWIGPEQDPLIHHPIHYCGLPTIMGKNYCEEHYARVYIKGSAVRRTQIAKLIVEDKNMVEVSVRDEEPKELEFTV